MRDSKKWIVLCIMSCFAGFVLGTAIFKENCRHEWKQGVSIEECREASKQTALPYPRSFYKCTKCDEIEVIINNVGL